jgi:hypothetical protein
MWSDKMEEGEKLSRVFLHSIGILKLDTELGRAAFGEVLMLTWGELLFESEAHLHGI